MEKSKDYEKALRAWERDVEKSQINYREMYKSKHALNLKEASNATYCSTVKDIISVIWD